MKLKWYNINQLVSTIISQMENDGFKPELILGPCRGGLIPGVILSHSLNVEFKPLSISLRDYPTFDISSYQSKNILVIDDICDSGKTIEQIRKVITCKVAVLVYNRASLIDIDYSGIIIDKSIKNEWVEFPWELNNT